MVFREASAAPSDETGESLPSKLKPERLSKPATIKSSFLAVAIAFGGVKTALVCSATGLLLLAAHDGELGTELVCGSAAIRSPRTAKTGGWPPKQSAGEASKTVLKETARSASAE